MSLTFAYADPPYPGQSAKHYADHPDYAGEVNHAALVDDLLDYAGWALSTHVAGLFLVQRILCDRGLEVSKDYRVMVWVKPFAAFKRNVKVAYTWEPVFVRSVRTPEPGMGMEVLRDHVAEPIARGSGVVGAKPERFCRWLFEVAGLDRSDTFVDLFPGSGAVTRAHERWCRERPLVLP